jgi:hypothetical protein
MGLFSSRTRAIACLSLGRRWLYCQDVGANAQGVGANGHSHGGLLGGETALLVLCAGYGTQYGETALLVRTQVPNSRLVNSEGVVRPLPCGRCFGEVASPKGTARTLDRPNCHNRLPYCLRKMKPTIKNYLESKIILPMSKFG